MKPFLFRFVLTWVVFCPYLRGEDAPSTPAPSADTTTQETVVPIGPGEFVPPAPKPPIPSVPESEVIQRSRVFQGGRFVTTEELVPLDEPPAVEQTAVPAPTPEEIAADRAEWLEESRAHPEVMLSLSGTVYDHKATLLRWRDGDEEFQAWSNIDFNVMRGMSSVEVGSTTYLIFMMIGDESTTPSIVKSGVVIAPKLPTIPPIPNEPGFVLVKGSPENLVATGGIKKLHELYRTHKAQFDAAYEQRLRYEAAALAWGKEHPPQPENVTVRWWRGKRAAQPGPGGQTDTKPKGATP